MTTTERPTTMCRRSSAPPSWTRTPLRYGPPGSNQTMTWRDYARGAAELPAWQVQGSARRHGLADDGEPDRVLPARRRLLSTSAPPRFRNWPTPLPAEQLTYVFDNAGTKVVICEQRTSTAFAPAVAHRTHRLRRWRAPALR